MKVEFNINKKSVMVLILFVVLIASFFFLGWWVGQDRPVEQSSVGFLTVQDLNRSDIVAGAYFSRFCEGMGYSSSLFWQSDLNGNTYGVPICVEVRPQ